MSIATEITRLQNAKASIKTSIENKGVTVPSATKLDGYSTLIDSIPTGSQVTVESLTVTQNGTYQESGKAYSPVVVDVPAMEDYLAKAVSGETFSYENDEITTIVTRAFSYAKPISLSFPNVTTVGEYCFYGCTTLTSLNLPKVKTVSGYMCQGCSSLVDYDFSNVTAISNQNSFYGCGFTGVYAPACTGIGAFAQGQFENCSNLVYARFPINHANVLRSRTFQNCSSLKLVDLGKISSSSYGIASAANCFAGCTSLEVLILRQTGGVVKYYRATDFANVSSPVTVYVPSALKSQYETATNWSSYVANNKVVFADLEGSPYENPAFVYEGVPA